MLFETAQTNLIDQLFGPFGSGWHWESFDLGRQQHIIEDAEPRQQNVGLKDDAAIMVTISQLFAPDHNASAGRSIKA
ncbi:unnamed protein product, partial [marine sediment metagenome]